MLVLAVLVVVLLLILTGMVDDEHTSAKHCSRPAAITATRLGSTVQPALGDALFAV